VPGWQVEEHREAGEALSRVDLTGRVGTHQILASIIPREIRSSADPTKTSQTAAYFQALRSAMTWTDVSDSTFQAPARTYPVLFGTEIVHGPISALDSQQDNTVLLYFPDDFPLGRYFYVFFWTDIHSVGSQPGTLEDLKTLVDSFEVRASPVGAPSKGCGS